LRDGVTESTELLDWMKKTASGSVERKNLSVAVLSPERIEVARYNVQNAWPSS
jgi:phage tail-like protein